MLGGFVSGLLGTAMILASVVMILATFDNPLWGFLGIFFLLAGWYLLYASQQTVRIRE